MTRETPHPWRDLPPLFLLGMVGKISQSHLAVAVGDGNGMVAPELAPKKLQQLCGAGVQQPQSCSTYSQSGSSVLPQDIHFSFLLLQYLKEITGISAKGKMVPSDAPACFCQLNNSCLTCHPSLLAPGISTSARPVSAPSQTCLSQAIPGDHRLQITQADSKIQYLALLLNTFTPTGFLKPSH